MLAFIRSLGATQSYLRLLKRVASQLVAGISQTSDKERFFKFYKDHKLEPTTTTRLGELLMQLDCNENQSKRKRRFKA